MTLEHIPLKATPTRATQMRQKSKRVRQQGRLNISQQLTYLATHFAKVPVRELAPFQLYNM